MSWCFVKAQGQLYLTEVEWEGADWMYLPWDRDQWWVLVNAVIKLWSA